MIAALLLSLNFILKLGRQKRECISLIDAAHRGKHHSPEKTDNKGCE